MLRDTGHRITKVRMDLLDAAGLAAGRAKDLLQSDDDSKISEAVALMQAATAALDTCWQAIAFEDEAYEDS